MNRSFRQSLLAAAAIAGLAGCGRHVPHSDKPRADVFIQITAEGRPVTSGDVDLHNFKSGEGGGGTLDSTGTALIPGVVLGEYVVTVLPHQDDPLPQVDGLPRPSTGPKAKIPAQMQSPQKSPFRITVTERGAEARFDLVTGQTVSDGG